LSEPLIITKSLRDDNQLDLTIQLGPERTEQALQQAIKLVSKKAKIPGFRPGKAPAATVLRMFGKEAILSEIADDLGQEVFKETLDSEHIEPYAQASLNDVTFDPVTFKLTVPMPPTVELGDYRSLRVEAPAAEATEADVDAALEQARAAKATVETVARPAQLGDTVRVDIKGVVGENTIMDNQDWELQLRGESGWLPGFDEAFAGLSAGEDKEFDLTYPEDSMSRYKGQIAHFSVSIKEVKSRVLPEIDDELVKSLGDYTDVADYRAKKLTELQEVQANEARTQLNNKAVEALIANATINYPPVALDMMTQEMLRDMEVRFQNIGYTLQDSLRLQGKTIEGYRQELRPLAEQRLKGRLALEELAEREGITVTAEEEQAEVDRMLGQVTDENESAQQLRETINGEGMRAMMRDDLLTSKTIERLRAIVTGQAGEAPAAETEAAQPLAAATTEAEAEAVEASDATEAAATTEAAEETPTQGE
jgi:trigger factor